MSQAKVDRRKELKKNRKQMVAQEKRKNALVRLIGYLCLICIIGGFGYSIYSKVNPAPEPNASAFYNLIAKDDYNILAPSIAEAE